MQRTGTGILYLFILLAPQYLTAQQIDSTDSSVQGERNQEIIIDDTSSHTYTLPEPDGLRLSVHSTQAPVKLDGILDEPSWQDAETASRFRQHYPEDRTPATERTVVRVLQDEKHIYFGIMCYDKEPDKIVANDMRRDSGLGNDDFIGLYLDTYHDHRNFYYFSTNPLGTRRDGIVTDAKYYNTNWDGIWECSSARTEYGWSTEIQIPFSTLRFRRTNPMTWGFNVSRQIRRKQERVFWAPIPRELGRPGTWRGEFFGQLDGIRTTVSTNKLELEPYMLSGGQRLYNPNKTNSKFESGGDVRFHFTANLRGDVSYNTDFAQVEADREIVNFTRYPTFFPEKREFFLEREGLFNVGYPGDVLFFYSRRIGISQGREIPIIGAAKLSGRIGDYSLGVMNVQTEAVDIGNGETTLKEPETNYGIVRVKRDIFTNSSIGAVLTNKQSGSGYYNRLLGVDGNIWINPSLKFETHMAKTYTTGLTRDDFIGIWKLVYTINNFSADVRHYIVAPDYNAEMGYITESDFLQTFINLGYTQWINSHGIQNISWAARYWYVTYYNQVFWFWWARGGASVTLNSGDVISYSAAREQERVRTMHYIGPVRINTGDYPNGKHTVSFSTNPSRPLSTSIGYTDENYWTGKRRHASLSQNFQPHSKLSIDLIYAYNTVTHPTASFDTNTMSNRILYAFTTDLFVKSYVQWNDFDKRISANFLLRYTYKPGSDLYLVYNEIRDRLRTQTMSVRDRILMLKISYNIRI